MRSFPKGSSLSQWLSALHFVWHLLVVCCHLKVDTCQFFLSAVHVCHLIDQFFQFYSIGLGTTAFKHLYNQKTIACENCFLSWVLCSLTLHVETSISSQWLVYLTKHLSVYGSQTNTDTLPSSFTTISSGGNSECTIMFHLFDLASSMAFASVQHSLSLLPLDFCSWNTRRCIGCL